MWVAQRTVRRLALPAVRQAQHTWSRHRSVASSDAPKHGAAALAASASSGSEAAERSLSNNMSCQLLVALAVMRQEATDFRERGKIPHTTTSSGDDIVQAAAFRFGKNAVQFSAAILSLGGLAKIYDEVLKTRIDREVAEKEKRQAAVITANPENVYNRICSGRAVLSPDTLQQLVRRKAPLQKFEELLECTDGLHHVFYVWTGAQGIGKTTIAKMACSEIIKGVTFLRAPKPGNTEDAKKGLTNSLAAALDFSLLDRDSYLEVLSCYEAQAQRFAEKEKRPAVLVIDAIEDLEQTLQVEMIRRAKDWADEGIIRVVFVTSPGKFLATIREIRRMSRAKFITMKGMNDSEAMKYLCALPKMREIHLRPGQLWSEERIATFMRVAELCGDRFAPLEEVGRAMATAKEDPGVAGVEVVVAQSVSSAFSKAGLGRFDIRSDLYSVAVPALHALALSEKGSMHEDEFLELFSSAAVPSLEKKRFLGDLVNNDIISCVGGIVEFQSRAVRWFAQSTQRLPPPKRG